ncbi:uncharacterized protein G2W53_041811 [Senna tora]|uniref:Uncharacterized protein n=1 Tax=Senna tora TaxID=362788 RepID=A0A834VZG6_9FABA|nr:uncharacterized protein G2W53_041811 [Senna tora]
MPLLAWRFLLGPSGIVRIDALIWRMPLWAERDCTNRRAHLGECRYGPSGIVPIDALILENASMGGAGLYKSTRSSWRMPLWAERDCSNRRAHLENASMGGAGLFESMRSFGECLYGRSGIVRIDALIWKMPLWAERDCSNRRAYLENASMGGAGLFESTRSFGECLYGRSGIVQIDALIWGIIFLCNMLLARDKQRNLLLLLMDEMPLRSDFLANGSFFNLRPFFEGLPIFMRKDLPIDEGILRPSLLGNFSSLSSAEGSFTLPLGGGIFLPSLWRDRSFWSTFCLVILQLAPLEGSIVRSPS